MENYLTPPWCISAVNTLRNANESHDLMEIYNLHVHVQITYFIKQYVLISFVEVNASININDDP